MKFLRAPMPFKVLVAILLIVTLGTESVGSASLSNQPDFIWDSSSQASSLNVLSNQDGLRVFWWNIHEGNSTSGISKPDFGINLSRLIESKLAPDVISFAEFTEHAVPAEALRLLKQNYPYSYLFPYQGAPGEGVSTYSKLPLKLKSLDYLDYLPPFSLDEKETNDYRQFACKGYSECIRPLPILSVKKGDREYTLVPTHLYDSWRNYKERYGKLKTFLEILYGDENPLYYQMARMKQQLEMRLKSKLRTPGVIVYGDFNTPTRLLGIQTGMYKTLARGFENGLTTNAPSFPARDSLEAKSYPRMQIDHAFVSPGTQIQRGVVLPIRGSDHYPLYFIVQ